jgi:hypothetical protein
MKAWGLRLIALLRSTFPEIARDKRHWRVAEVPLPPQQRMLILPGSAPEAENGANLALLLHPKPDERFIRFTLLGDMATTVLLGVVNPKTGMSESVNRETFPNDCWDSFVGWMAVTKEEYERYHRPRARVYRVKERITFWDVRESKIHRFAKDEKVAVASDYKALLDPITGAHLATVDPDEVIRAIQAKAIVPEGVTPGTKQVTSRGLPFKYVGQAAQLVLESSSSGVPPQTFKQGDTISLIEVPEKDVPYLAVPWPPHDPVGEIAVPLKITWAEVKNRQAMGEFEAAPVAPTAPDSAKATEPGKDARKYKLLPGCMFTLALGDGTVYGFTTKDTIHLTDTHVTIVQGDGKVHPSSDDPDLRSLIDAAIRQGILDEVGGPLLWRLYKVTSKTALSIDTPEGQEMQDGWMVTVQGEAIELQPGTYVGLTPEFGLIATLQPGRPTWDNYPLNDAGERLVRRWVKEGSLEADPDRTSLTDDDLTPLLCPPNPLDAEITMPDKPTWTEKTPGSPSDPEYQRYLEDVNGPRD